MPHPQHDSSTTQRSTPQPSTASPLTRMRRHARDQDIVTESGFRQGYIAFKPSRWMGRFVTEFLQLNDALQHLEGNSFTLLAARDVDFAMLIRALLHDLADYRRTTERLTAQATELALGRARQGKPGNVNADETALDLNRELAAWEAPSLAEERGQGDGQEVP